MKYQFFAYGHQNIRGTHKTTFEFTKDEELSLKGDCIIGVKSNFDKENLKKFIQGMHGNKLKIRLESAPLNQKIIDTIECDLNEEFNGDRELVIRKTNYISGKTLAMNSNKAACELSRELIDFLKKAANKIIVKLISI